MKFQDIFVPRWQNSNPETRIKAVMRLNDKKLLSQIIEMDEDDRVRSTAREKLAELKAEGKKVTA